MKNKSDIPKQIGRYEIVNLIAEGGMGEVYLVYDPLCSRQIALKKIRSNLLDYKGIRQRFLREAKITAQLNHPSILPIYAIHAGEEETYYTMPFVEGETLNKILQNTREKEETGATPHEIGVSIPALTRIFHNICLAMAYCHSKGILHRDLKPDNVIVGKYGEVMLLDWGIAEKIDSPEKEEEHIPIFETSQLTQPGKVLGTIGYLAPERAKGEKATIKTDIYSLGAMLYRLITLVSPFKRNSLKEFRKKMHLEELSEPSEVAPYRDIPNPLADIAKKCLSFKPQNRYEQVEDLIVDLENYIQGKPGWVFSKSLNTQKKEAWEFQENVPLAKDIALTRITKELKWAYLMLSKERFSGNLRIECEFTIKKEAEALGFLINVPEANERKGLQDGYCLWLNFKGDKSIKFYRSNVEVLEIADPGIIYDVLHKLVIEKVDDTFQVYINQNLILNYVSHIPLFGAHIGFLATNMHFTISPLSIFLGSYHIMINCLAIPDAFLARKDYSEALEEYRRISTSFTGRTEGREALFRAGLTLIEQAKRQKLKRDREHLFQLAIEEFEKLRHTPAAPLEYLGKSMVYTLEKETDEEMKCFELALRKYPNHPLLGRLEERIAYRLSECSKTDRRGAFYFAFLALRHLPHIFQKSDESRLLNNLIENLDSPLFFYDPPSFHDKDLYFRHIAYKLAFWLSMPHALEEMLAEYAGSEEKEWIVVQNGLLSLMSLGYRSLAITCMEDFDTDELLTHSIRDKNSRLQNLLETFVSTAPKHLEKKDTSILFYLLQRGLTRKNAESIIPFLETLEKNFTFAETERENFLSLRIWFLLLSKKWKECDEIFETIHLTHLTRGTSLLHMLYGCFLLSQEGKPIGEVFLSSVIELPYPPLHALLSHYLYDKFPKHWMKTAFYWEKRTLFRQLILYHHCAGEDKEANLFEKKLVNLEQQQKEFL